MSETPDGGLVDILYENVHNVGKVTSMAADYLGNLLWSVESGGLTDGAIVRAKVDDPNPETVHAITRTLDAAYALCYKNGFLFFAGADQDANSEVHTDEMIEKTGQDDDQEEEEEDSTQETEVTDDTGATGEDDENATATGE